MLPLRPFGRHTDVKVSALAYGGHHLGDAPDEDTAVRMVREAVDGGITFFDNCWEYHRGSMGGSGEMITNGAVTPKEALIYAMSLPVAVTISGMESMGVLRQNLEIVAGFQPLSAAEMQSLRDRCRPDAADGRWELFKTTKKYDGDVGREQHGFPSAEELPA